MVSKYLTPAREGHFWAKLKLADQPDGEDWNSANWEVVQVFDNNGEGDEAFMVSVPGVSRSQAIDAFVWGPPVHRPEDLR
jgi:hypothetical protein